ncbi:MAG: GIY-YIG nuclease family protein [Candidatus Omnitrophica bacterium]|nr:GIY-YIG nuclease family protein [Candidatus Omnitrophota bacterium]
MHHVYILRSKKDQQRIYIGHASDLDKRLRKHNESKTVYTKRYAPWYIETYIAFIDKKLAIQFEKYLKSGSGKTFLKRRLMR